MAARTAIFAAALALCLTIAAAADSAAVYTASAPFDWGRPCTLYGTNSATETTLPDNKQCTNCGSGSTATPEPLCTFKGVTYSVGETIYIKYHSSVHNLYIGSSACDFKTNICPNATSDEVSATKPCTYKFTTAGSYYISDMAGANVGNGYCKDFGAYLPVTVGTSS